MTYAEVICRDSKINGDFNLANLKGEESQFNYSEIGGTFNLQNVEVDYLYLNMGHFKKVNFNNASFVFLKLTHTRINECTNIDNLKVETYLIDKMTYIPENLKCYLENNSKISDEFDSNPVILKPD